MADKKQHEGQVVAGSEPKGAIQRRGGGLLVGGFLVVIAIAVILYLSIIIYGSVHTTTGG